ncbi:MAG TPA: ABATE domain-containing protein [Verrucomicrobiae bacterium]|nr:ABATE domain-containing protein [Verrucomicrobiae bacterium]
MVTNPFKFIAGALCLDFVNTVGAWVDGDPLRDKFVHADDLKNWARLANLQSPCTPMPDAILRRAVVLRQALHRIFSAVIGGRAPARRDLDVLNRELTAARSQEFLQFADNGYCLQFAEAPQRVLWAVVRSAAELLTSADLARLRQCPGDECGWLFLDTSRNGMRQWCQMRICGNRAKARKFRRRWSR